MSHGRMLSLLACLAVVTVFVSPAGADEAEPRTYSGTVVHTDGSPVSAAKVGLYGVTGHFRLAGYNLIAETASDEEGRFHLTAVLLPEASLGRLLFIVAQGPGLAIGWKVVLRDTDQEVTLTLGPPSIIAGCVVDELGAPIAGADVALIVMDGPTNAPRPIIGLRPLDSLRTRTDGQGRFSFANIPSDARAFVLAGAPGRASYCSVNPTGRPYRQWPIFAATTDVVVVLRPEAVVEGTVLDRETGKGVPGITVELDSRLLFFTVYGPPTAVSAADGSFRLSGLPAGHCAVRPVPRGEDLEKWYASPVRFRTTAGETFTVTIELQKSGTLLVRVTSPLQGADPRRPGDRGIGAGLLSISH